MDLYIGYGQYFAPDSWAVSLGPILIAFLGLCAYTAFKVKKTWVTTALVTVPVLLLWVLAAVHQYEGWLLGTSGVTHAEFDSTEHIVDAVISQIMYALMAVLAITAAYKICKPQIEGAPPPPAKRNRIGRFLLVVLSVPIYAFAVSTNFIVAWVSMIGLHASENFEYHHFFVGADALHSAENVEAGGIDYTWFEPDTIKVQRALWNISGAGLVPPVYSWWVGEDVSRPKIDQLAAVHLTRAGSDKTLPLICGYYDGKLTNADWLIATPVNLLDEPAFKHVTDLCPATFPSDVTLSEPTFENLFKPRTSQEGR